MTTLRSSVIAPNLAGVTGTYAPMTLGGGWRTWAMLVFQLVTTVALVSLLPTLVIFEVWSQSRALQAQWTVAGPACDRVDRPAAWATSHRRDPIRFTYGGATFTRQFAAVSCAAVPKSWWWPQESYAVCMFANPGAVTVGTIDGPVTFQPPYGQPATVTVRDGQASCVVGGRFRP